MFDVFIILFFICHMELPIIIRLCMKKFSHGRFIIKLLLYSSDNKNHEVFARGHHRR